MGTLSQRSSAHSLSCGGGGKVSSSPLNVILESAALLRAAGAVGAPSLQASGRRKLKPARDRWSLPSVDLLARVHAAKLKLAAERRQEAGLRAEASGLDGAGPLPGLGSSSGPSPSGAPPGAGPAWPNSPKLLGPFTPRGWVDDASPSGSGGGSGGGSATERVSAARLGHGGALLAVRRVATGGVMFTSGAPGTPSSARAGDRSEPLALLTAALQPTKGMRFGRYHRQSPSSASHLAPPGQPTTPTLASECGVAGPSNDSCNNDSLGDSDSLHKLRAVGTARSSKRQVVPLLAVAGGSKGPTSDTSLPSNSPAMLSETLVVMQAEATGAWPALRAAPAPPGVEGMGIVIGAQCQAEWKGEGDELAEAVGGEEGEGEGEGLPRKGSKASLVKLSSKVVQVVKSLF